MENANGTQNERDGGAQHEREHGAGEARDGGMGSDAPLPRGVTESPSHTLSTNRCSSTNRFGEPCKAKAVKDGKCAMHSGLTDPRQMGRAGGLKAPETELRKAVKEDDSLRQQARDTLRRALAGENVPRTALEAAKSLFAFRAAQPPAEAPGEREPLRTPKGRPVTSLTDVLAFGLEIAPAEMEKVIADARAIAAGASDPVQQNGAEAA